MSIPIIEFLFVESIHNSDLGSRKIKFFSKTVEKWIYLRELILHTNQFTFHLHNGIRNDSTKNTQKQSRRGGNRSENPNGIGLIILDTTRRILKYTKCEKDLISCWNFSYILFLKCEFADKKFSLPKANMVYAVKMFFK